MLHDAGGGLGHPCGPKPKHPGHKSRHREGQPQGAQRRTNVHRLGERQGLQRGGALIDARGQQGHVRTLGTVDLLLKLQRVEEFVLDVREVVTHDACGFVVPQTAAQTEPLEHGPHDLRQQHPQRGRSERVEQHGPARYAKTPHMLETRQGQCTQRQGGKRQQDPSEGLVSMVPPNEFIQLFKEGNARCHLLHMKGTLPSTSIHNLRHERKDGFPFRRLCPVGRSGRCVQHSLSPGPGHQRVEPGHRSGDRSIRRTLRSTGHPTRRPHAGGGQVGLSRRCLGRPNPSRSGLEWPST